MANTWYVGVSSMRGPSVRIIACSTLIICAMLAIRTRSAWWVKMSSVNEATSASRSVFCCCRKPGLVPGSGAYQVPHSSTTRATFFSGSYLSITALWRVIRSSIRSASDKVWIQPLLSKSVDDWLGGQPPATV